MVKKEDKLDKIIKLLEEIKASQAIPYYVYPPIYYYPPQPQPYLPQPWVDPHWTNT